MGTVTCISFVEKANNSGLCVIFIDMCHIGFYLVIGTFQNMKCRANDENVTAFQTIFKQCYNNLPTISREVI